MVKANRENDPNAAIAIFALRRLGYTNVAAVSDLIDNALDAGATAIQLFINQNDEGIINMMLVDNGSGMNHDVLDQALRIGSMVEDRNIIEELGKFGMGLATASISIARQLRVTTSTTEMKEIIMSTQDIDEVREANKWVKYLGEADQNTTELYNLVLPDGHGTIVELVNCDQLTNKNITQLKNKFIKEISRVFREHINAGREFYVNNTLVEATDPLELHDGGEVYSDETYEINYKNQETGQEITEEIRVRLGILPDHGVQVNRAKGYNSHNSGFYVMRNHREIEAGQSLDFFTKHPAYNLFRGEIYFNAALDEAMGIDFRKKGLDMDQSVFDQLAEHIKPQLTAIVNRLRKSKVAKEQKEIDHGEAEKQIAKKARLLNTPKPKDVPKPPKEDEGKDKRPRKKEEKPRAPKTEKRVRFEAHHGTPHGHIYTAEMEGKTVVISWNIDHPFYDRFVVNTQDDRTLATSVDFLVYCLATAELQMATNEDTIELLEQIKTLQSMNLNILLR